MDNDPGARRSVEAKAILRALHTIRRRRHWPLLQDLERLEPELADHVLESLSDLHQTLLLTGAKPKIVRRLQRQVQSLVLVVLLASGLLSEPDDPPSATCD